MFAPHAFELGHMSDAEQLAAVARLHELLERHGIEYWLFGGWAVDFHARSITREHADVDIAVWAKDNDRIAALLVADEWKHAPEDDEDGYTGYERGTVRLGRCPLGKGVGHGWTFWVWWRDNNTDPGDLLPGGLTR